MRSALPPKIVASDLDLDILEAHTASDESESTTLTLLHVKYPY